MNRFTISELSQLEELRQSRAIVYFGEDQAPFPKAIEDDDARILYECLRRSGAVERLDLVLHTYGGRINASRKLGRLLHDFAPEVHILVPYKARSAGTLLCLSANQIVMHPLAELGPIDAHIGSAGDAPPGSPPVISSEDIRAFRQMAETWFGLQSEEHRMQVFSLLSQRFFPTSLSSFFRSDQQVRQIAGELLGYQLPQADDSTRQRIVDRLVSGFPAHDYSITRSEAQQLGLRVCPASPQEETLLWSIWQACRQYVDSSSAQPEQPGGRKNIDGILASADFTALHVVEWIEYLPSAGNGQVARPTVTVANGYWHIL